MKTMTFLVSVAIAGMIGCTDTDHDSTAISPTRQTTAADNTERNVRDRSGGTLTPLDQSESEADRTMTQKLRQALMANDALSTLAQNIKIITVNGLVTLRGPVNNEKEKAAVAAAAQQIAGSQNVDNQLEIAMNN